MDRRLCRLLKDAASSGIHSATSCGTGQPRRGAGGTSQAYSGTPKTSECSSRDPRSPKRYRVPAASARQIPLLAPDVLCALSRSLGNAPLAHAVLPGPRPLSAKTTNVLTSWRGWAGYCDHSKLSSPRITNDFQAMQMCAAPFQVSRQAQKF
jgi:hypothetical protein